MDNEVIDILQKTFHSSNWIIQKTKHGLSKETFKVSNDKKMYFVKFDVNIPPLVRVVELGIAPKIVVTGTCKNKTYIIQEFIDGYYPSRNWFNVNLKKLAEFIKIYHSDRMLFDILKKDSEIDYKMNVQSSLKFVEKELEKVKEIIKPDQIKNDLEKLISQSNNLIPVELTPIHTDPNYKNFLLFENKLYMLDWDDVRLSDPVRDIAPLLWWYVEKEKWQEFFKNFGLDLNDDLLNRIYWWMARQSLTIAIFFAKKKDENQVNNYLADFKSALNRDTNPQINKETTILSN